MISPNLEWSFTRYLAAKKSVDDRALNRAVWQALCAAIEPRQAAAPLSVLEIGAGIGTMFERLLDWGLLRRATYTAIDLDARNIASAHARLKEWAAHRGLRLSTLSEGPAFENETMSIALQLEAIDLYDFIQREVGKRQWDLLIAHAFLDLVDIPRTLPRLFQLLRPDSLFYFTLNFDGLTILEPEIDAELDERIIRLYHRTMDERIVADSPSGDSCAGRHLFVSLQRAGAEIIAAGPSDWVVFPQHGVYPGDEAYFLHFILHTIHSALAGHPELDGCQLQRWIEQRHAQVEAGSLVYIAHQLDFVGRHPGKAETAAG